MKLVDKFGRTVNYLRLSVTDRCDFRCSYCMSDTMAFADRDEVLSIDELKLVAQEFKFLGVKKIRITGGEPLIRKGVIDLITSIKAMGVETALTTNASQLSHMATDLYKAGLDSINISIDSLKSDRFKKITRTGNLSKVLNGIEAARSVGFNKIKLNSVILKGQNEDEIFDLVQYAVENSIDISFIEEMPLGEISSHKRSTTHIPSHSIRELIKQRYELIHTIEKSAGPSTYYKLKNSNTKVGFISPHSHNFCSDCNRVRVTATGRLLLCLGHEYSVDLKSIFRCHEPSTEKLRKAIIGSMSLKPESHKFTLDDEIQILRFMNATGG